MWTMKVFDNLQDSMSWCHCIYSLVPLVFSNCSVRSLHSSYWVLLLILDVLCIPPKSIPSPLQRLSQC